VSVGLYVEWVSEREREREKSYEWDEITFQVCRSRLTGVAFSPK
jgi:hypothetical protein